MMCRIALFFSIFLVFAGACRPEAPGGRAVAVHNGRLWNGSGGPAIPDGVVVLRGDRIDARGGFIMPGVIDNHVHLNLLLETEKDPLTPWLRAGVTTLVDTGSPKGGVARLRERAAAASQSAPRLFVSGPIFTAVDGGMAPRDVLLAATRHGAEILGKGEELGTLAPGRLADLIVIEGDPLVRIEDMGRVRVVIRGGEVIAPSAKER